MSQYIFILEKMDEYDSKELREVQKKLSIISEAFEKEKAKNKNILQTLKDYEELTNEKEYQINDLQKLIEDIHSKITLVENEKNENIYSNKLTGFIGNFFSKNVENSQKIETLIDEFNYVKQEYENLSDKVIKQKELNIEQENQFMKILNGQKDSFNKIKDKISSLENQNKELKLWLENINKKILNMKEEKEKKKEEIKQDNVLDEVKKLIVKNNEVILDYEKKIKKKQQEKEFTEENIKQVEEDIKQKDDIIYQLNESFPCYKEINGKKERFEAYFNREEKDSKIFNLYLKNDSVNEVYNVNNFTSFGKNMSDKTKWMCIYNDNNEKEIEFILIFNINCIKYFEEKYFYILTLNES